MRRTLTLSALLLLGAAEPLQAQQPLNLDFERVSTEGATRPWNWTPLAYAPGTEVLVDSAVAREGRRSLRISRLNADTFLGPHAFATNLRPTATLGKELPADRP